MRLKTPDYIVITAAIGTIICTIFSSEMHGFLIGINWRLILFCVAVLIVLIRIVHISLRSKIDTLISENRKHSDELTIIKHQNSLRYAQFKKMYSNLWSGYNPSIEKEKENLTELLKKEWKHRDNNEIESMVEKFYEEKEKI